MHDFDLILTLAGGLGAALVFGYVTHRLGLSPIVGYLLAGVAVGPFTPGFVADRNIAEQLAEIGVVLLMFGVGLQFHLEELLAVRRVAIPGAIVQSFVATVLGAVMLHAFGWSWTAGIVFGLAISVASTVVLTRVLTDNRDLHTPTGHISIGWLVVEDLFTVLVLVLLPALFGGGEIDASRVGIALGLAVVKIAALVACTLVIGGRVLPWMLERAVATGSRELFTLTVLVLALGIAVGSAKLFDVSMALGAFLAGIVVGRSDFSLRAATEALPMRDAFAVLFFVSVGMLLDPRHFVEAPGLIAATVAVIMIGKPLAALVIVLARGYAFKVALAVGAALSQIGEFSFILATLGKQLGILDSSTNNTLIAAAIITITLNPPVYRSVDWIDLWLSQKRRVWRWLSLRRRGLIVSKSAAGQSSEDIRTSHRAVVIGYGPVGQTVSRLLRDNEIEPTVVEMNLATVRRLRGDGIPAVYGDARHRDTLLNAGVTEARTLILSSAGMEGSEETIRLAREMNPDIHIIARSSYLRQLPALRRAGANSAFSGEGEVALAVAETVLRELGATPEQIDRERDRVQSELFEKILPAEQTDQPPAPAATAPPAEIDSTADAAPTADAPSPPGPTTADAPARTSDIPV